MIRINWKYCECGCKSYKAEIGSLLFQVYWDLKDGWYYYGPENPYPSEPILVKTQAEATKLARKRVREELEEISKACDST